MEKSNATEMTRMLTTLKDKIPKTFSIIDTTDTWNPKTFSLRDLDVLLLWRSPSTRIIKSGLFDLFVDSLHLATFGLKMEFQENGLPAYHPSDLLKLFLYGYLNRIRSSRGHIHIA